MQQQLFQEKYPIFSLELDKTETRCNNVDEIVAYFKDNIDTHKIATLISVFDHYSHTQALEDGSIDESILDAKDIVFCFGTALPNPQVLAVRPRSIGIAELADKLVISFMEAPMPMANATMEAWVLALRNT